MKVFKKVLSAVLAGTMVLAMAMPVSAAKVSTFSDVDADAWYADAIERWEDAGILEGYGNGKFGPEDEVTRAQMTKMLYAILGVEEKAEYDCSFSDVKADDWFYDEVLAIADEGIVNGYPDGSFKPDNAISRQDAMTIFARGTGYGIDADAEVYEEILGEFDDWNLVGEWAICEVAGLVQSRVIKGDDKNGDGVYSIRPLDTITRAEAAVLLDRLIPVYVTADGKVSVTKELDYNSGLIVINMKQDHHWVIEYANDYEGNVEYCLKDTCSEECVDVNLTNQIDNYAGDVVYGPSISGMLKEGYNCFDGINDELNAHATYEYTCSDCCTGDVVVDCPVCGEVADNFGAHTHWFEDGVCDCCGMTKEEATKVYGKVSAGEVSVEGSVYCDYSAEVTITNGEAAFEKLDAEVEFIDVSYVGSRSWSKSLTTDIDMKVAAIDVVPSLYVFGEEELVLGEVECGSVTVNVDDTAVVYNISGETLADELALEEAGLSAIEGVVYTAVPEDVDAVREAVAAVRDHVSYDVEGNNNAGTIKNGSYITWGGKGVAFGVEGNDFTLDGVGTDLAAVKDYVANNISTFAVEDPVANQVEIKLVAGSVVTVMGRSLLLQDDCVITITAEALNTSNFDALLDAYQNGTQDELAQAALELVDALVAMTKTDNIVIDIVF